jgi:hypothetical protein
MVAPRIESGASGFLARNSDHYPTEEADNKFHGKLLKKL